MDKIGGFTVLHDGDLSSMRDARANGGLVVQPTVGTDEHFGYRTKITPHYNAPRRPDQLRIGFQQRGSRTIVDIDKCIIASEAINSEYERQRRAIRTDIEGAEKMPKKGMAQPSLDSSWGVPCSRGPWNLLKAHPYN